MTKRMSIRDLTRSGSSLLEYDYIDIEDKKAHEYKGVFVPSRYADEVKAFIEKKIKKAQEESLAKLMEFAGSNTLKEEFQGLSSRALREARARKHEDA